MIRSDYLRRLLSWLLTILCLVGIPAGLTFFATLRYYSVLEDQQRFELKSQAQQAADEVLKVADQEEFWCRLFFDQFNNLKRADHGLFEAIQWLEKTRKTFPNDVEYIAWQNDGRMVQQTFHSSFSADEWRHVIASISRFGGVFSNYAGFGLDHPDISIARKIVGPQLLNAMFAGLNNPARFSLCWTDSSGRKPPLGVYFVKDGGIIVFFDHTRFKLNSGVKYTINRFSRSRDATFGTFRFIQKGKTEIWAAGNIEASESLESSLINCEQNSLNFLETENYFVSFHFIDTSTRLFAFLPRRFSGNAILNRAAAVALIYMLLMLPFLRYTWKTSVNRESTRVSIKTKLAFLFLLASGIPLLALSVIAQEHYLHKRHTLMEDAHRTSTDMILSFDNRYLSNLDQVSMQLDQFFTEWGQKIAGRQFDVSQNDAIDLFIKRLNVENYYLISSSTNVIGAKAGYFRYRGTLDNVTLDLNNSVTRREATEVVKNDTVAANMIGKKVLSDLNRVEISGQTMSKLEIVAESILQKTFIEITHSIISAIGRINQWGFGQLKDFTYIRFIQTLNPEITDYLAMVFWRPTTLQAAFMKKAVTAANRNSSGFRLFSRNRLNSSFLPETAAIEPELESFAQRLGARPTEEIQIISYQGEDYLAVGFNGQHLDFYQLILLYPLANIDRNIDFQRGNLILLGLFSLLLAVGLAQILTRSFVDPLNILHKGALAIENRNFSHRLHGTGRDEFGEVAGIFNGIMVGFEELEVAKIVQESLFPAPEFNHNNCRIYGKSVCMNELGGDYLDFFKIDERHGAMLIGDVAGHGVGAALIMAMAKAGILSCKHILKSPVKVLAAMHQLILASKSSRQKKVMTFQYILFDSETGEITYANAGGCTPMLVKPASREVVELTQAGAALGAFKKAAYSETSFKLEPGESLIFYTDGIIESRDQNDTEIGYDNFKQILLESYNAGPQIFYDNICSRYQQHIGTLSAQDDLTIIVVTFCEASDQHSEARNNLL